MSMYAWLGIIGFIGYIWWKGRMEASADEALQLPALCHDDRDWTPLDQLVLDIARHDELARWHAEGRQLFRDAPVPDRDTESGWDVFVEGWGENITDRYEELFPELRAMPRKNRVHGAEGR